MFDPPINFTLLGQLEHICDDASHFVAISFAANYLKIRSFLTYTENESYIWRGRSIINTSVVSLEMFSHSYIITLLGKMQ